MTTSSCGLSTQHHVRTDHPESVAAAVVAAAARLAAAA